MTIPHRCEFEWLDRQCNVIILIGVIDNCVSVTTLIQALFYSLLTEKKEHSVVPQEEKA